MKHSEEINNANIEFNSEEELKIKCSYGDYCENSNPYLPEKTQLQMEDYFGHDFSKVQIHQNSKKAISFGVKAFAYGNALYFAPNAYNPYSIAGKKIIAHELTHVVQQRMNNKKSDLKSEEVDAKKSEEGFLRNNGKTSTKIRHKEILFPKIQFFEAPKHESIEYYALSKSFNPYEIQSIYYGNWMRDMNQAFAPILIDSIGYNNLYTILGVMSYRKFGKIPTEAQLGYYIPAEHLDNPAGAVPNSEYPTGSTIDKHRGKIAPSAAVNPEKSPIIPHAFITQQEPTHPDSKVVGQLGLFDYDNQGVTGFMRRSNKHLEKRLAAAAAAGRNENGFLHLGAALHVVEDLFAHSNFVEIAVDKAIREKKNQVFFDSLPGNDQHVQTFSPKKKVGNRTIPLLTTGSFTSNDTTQSLGHEAVNILRKEPEMPTLEKAILNINSFAVMANHLNENHVLKNHIISEVKKQTSLIPIEMIKNTSATTLISALNFIQTHMAQLSPDWLRKFSYSISKKLHDHLLVPTAKIISTNMLEKSVRDTSLINVYSQNEKAGEQTIFSKTYGHLFGEEAENEYLNNAKKGPEKQNEYLKKTPEEILAGPSHSQIGKDHSSSVFFGLAFQLAAEADKLIGTQIKKIWIKRGLPEYHVPIRTATKVGDKTVSFREGMDQNHKNKFDVAKIIMEKGTIHGNMTVAQSEKEMSDLVESFANLINDVSLLPEQAARLTSNINQLTGLKLKGSHFLLFKDLLDFSKESDQLLKLATDLKNPENRNIYERERIFSNYKKIETSIVKKVLSLKISSIKSISAAELYLTTMRRIGAYISPSYTALQDSILRRREHLVHEDGSNWQQMKYVDRNGNFGSTSRFGDDYTELLETSRMIMTNPYHTNWWQDTVQEFITTHPKIVRDSIIARNMGIANFRHKH